MEKYPFIFSDLRRHRVLRHVAFWLFWGVFQGFLYSFVSIFNTGQYPVRLAAAMAESFIFLWAHMFLAYSLMYFVIPKYIITHRYWLAACWVILLFIATASMAAGLSMTLIPAVRLAIMTPEMIADYREYNGGLLDVYMALLAGLRGGITIGGIAAAIKLMKYWYVKEQRNLQLQKENIASQLQVLKAQVHPHFLFNTLNNIYSYTQNTSAMASQLVIGLSDMLRYMLYEGNHPLVPLAKEIKMLRDYCNLEKVRYEKHFDLQVAVPEGPQPLLIAPLLLLPFVENCFKHGASNMLEQAWISLEISIEEDLMTMKLINSKPVSDPVTVSSLHSNGIGIQNVRARLNLLYAGRHDLAIIHEEALFIVNLKIKLDRIAPSTHPANVTRINPAYAIT